MLTTDETRHAITAAAEAAHAHGADMITTYHLLLGLATVPGAARHALAEVGLSGTEIRMAGERVFPVRPARPAGVTVPLAQETKDTVEAAVRYGLADGRLAMSTADLLQPIVARPDSTGMLVLAVAGGDADRIGTAMAQHRSRGCCAETDPNKVPAALAQAAAVTARLPGMAQFVGGVVGLVAAYATVVALVMAVSWNTAGPDAVLVYLAAGLVIAVATVAAIVKRRHIGRTVAARAPIMIMMPQPLVATLARHGLDQVEVRIQHGKALDRCFGTMSRAWIVLTEATARHEASLPFVLWHELAHAVRRDNTRRLIGAILTYAVTLASMLTFDVAATAAGIAGVVAVRWLHRWTAELACDRLAVAHCGPRALQAWAARARAAREQRRRWWLLPLLSHPPLAWRAARYPG